MKFAIFKGGRVDNLLEVGKATEVHLSAFINGETLYLVKKHSHINGYPFANLHLVKINTETVIFTKYSLEFYRTNPRSFLWSSESELEFIQKNSMAKHVLERIENG